MTQAINTTRLIIINDSRAEAERLISMLHNAGRPVRAQHVDSTKALTKILQEKSWDLIIGQDGCDQLPPSEVVKLVRRLNKDIPLILQTDRHEAQAVTEGMKMGAADVVTVDEDQHLLLVIQRELNNREERDKRRFAERRFNEITRRNQQLLDSSRDAIAYVQDGMFLYANDSFAELLNYDARDDLECLPVIDIVAKSEHGRTKEFLRDFTIKGDDIDATEFKVAVVLESGEEKNLTFDVRKTNYDEETCIQFVVRARSVDSQELEAQIEQIRNQDITTGLFNRAYLLETLESIVDKAIEKEYNSALFHIGIDNFRKIVHDRLGPTATDIALGTIATYAKSLRNEEELLCRFDDETFILVVPKISASQALEKAEILCQKLRDYIVDIEGSTLQFNYFIGIALITETSANTEVPIDHAIKALNLVKEVAEKDSAVLAKIYEPEAKKATRKDIASMVQRALDENRFKLLFQPILSLRGSNKEHYEVLLRMIDDDGKEISPTEFLSTAAKIGATTKLDRWVILESIKLLSGHRKKGHNTQLLLNLSRESMLDATLPPWLGVAFKAADLPRDAIVFQIREIDVNDHLNVASTFTEQLQAIGCDTSISHFGCALNPFNALKNVSSAYIKIDGSFTQDLQNNNTDVEALNELVSQLHQQDKITIVPFVENASVLSKLWQSGVHYIQGYYLQEPAGEMNYDFEMES
ncbi:MAG: GGDEF domain-containing response regulator [Alteromonadaceae bacterium]|nr:MAG: GGDEF domain-containing response regulator [Alteromonadaceae bacterium]